MIDAIWAAAIKQGAEESYDAARDRANAGFDAGEGSGLNAAYIVAAAERGAWSTVVGFLRELTEEDAIATPEDVALILEAHAAAARRVEAIFKKALEAYKLAVC